jgi:hypothetical protein
MSVLEVLGSLFKPLAELIEHVVPSGEARVKLKQVVLEAQIQAAERLMDYEKQLLDSQTQLIKAEALGSSWLQRTWRPITMLTFLVLTVADAFGWLPFRLAEQAWLLLQIGLGGYVAGRSLEKIAPAITAAIAEKK